MILDFNPKKLSRSMTRQQWREAYRWLRIVQGQLNRRLESDMLGVMTFGAV